jgi:hypothetical protein
MGWNMTLTEQFVSCCIQAYLHNCRHRPQRASVLRVSSLAAHLQASFQNSFPFFGSLKTLSLLVGQFQFFVLVPPICDPPPLMLHCREEWEDRRHRSTVWLSEAIFRKKNPLFVWKVLNVREVFMWCGFCVPFASYGSFFSGLHLCIRSIFATKLKKVRAPWEKRRSGRR